MRLDAVKEEYRHRFQMNLGQWLLYHQRQVVFDKCHWMGVKAYKNPFDAWIYQEALYDVKPDVVIEIGSAEGGSTLYLAHLLDLLGGGIVVSIDIDRSKFSVKHERIVTLTGDSSSGDMIAKVSAICQGKKVLVIHDGDHRKDPCLKDLRAYSKFVTLNSYLIVEDGIIDLSTPGDGIGTLEPGPLAAIQQFVSENPHFVIDEDRERYLLTYNPRGFLKRVR